MANDTAWKAFYEFQKNPVYRGDLIILNNLDEQKNVQVLLNDEIHSVTEVVGNYIRLDNDQEIFVTNKIAYGIANKWEELMERDIPHIYEAPIPIDDSIIYTIKHLSKKWIYKTVVNSLVRNAAKGINVPEQKCWNSHYNPRDNDYKDTTYYYYVVVRDNTLQSRFIQFLKDNNLYESETQTTIHFK